MSGPGHVYASGLGIDRPPGRSGGSVDTGIIGGSSSSGPWPFLIGADAENAVHAAEAIRSKLAAISLWCDAEMHEDGFADRVVTGLVRQAGMDMAEARAVADGLVGLLNRLQTALLESATFASVFGRRVQSAYIEPVTRAQAAGHHRSSGGLTVNR